MSISNGDGARGRDEALRCILTKKYTGGPLGDYSPSPFHSPHDAALIERSRLVLAAVWGSGGGPRAKGVGASGRQPGPLGGGTSVRGEMAPLGNPPLRPAHARGFPRVPPTLPSQ